MSNTYKDFLKTADREHDSYITCPSCGSPMGVRIQGYQMIATDGFRLELNNNIASLRTFLEKLESLLEQRNQPLDPLTRGDYPYEREKKFYSENFDTSSLSEIPDEFDENNDTYDEEEYGSVDNLENRVLGNDGNYRGVIGKEVSEKFVKEELDFFQDIDKFENFPLKDEPDEDLIYKKCIMLLRGIEPRSLGGPLSYLILDQNNVFSWRQNLSTPEGQEIIKKLLNQVCPTIQWYFNKLLELHRKRKENEKIPRAVLRAQFILALMLGHKGKDRDQLKNEFKLDQVEIEKNVRYELPRLTEISYRNLLRLLNSEVLLGNSKLKLSDEFRKAMKVSKNKASRNSSQQNADPQKVQNQPKSQNTYESRVVSMINRWGQEINKLVHFSCKGLVGKNMKRCGWYPKNTKTHSVILLGSRGTGKSSVMLTGLVAFRRYAASLGATVALDLPEDREEMLRLEQMYQSGEFFGKTQLGDKTSIKLSVKFPENDPSKRIHFVFTDVPGEVFESSLTEKGSSSWVLKVLKNAETIVFFFDLLMESAIRDLLTKTRNFETWKSALEQFDRVNKSREGKASIPQLDLLEQLLIDLQREREDVEGINFICVIPKSDMYADRDNQDAKFFSAFYQKLEGYGLLTQSEYDREDNESFDSLCSLGGTAYKPRETRESKTIKTKVENQERIGRIMSNLARECLLNIKNALGEEANPSFKSTLLDLIQLRLITNLEKTFGEEKVYFLPTSGQGKDNSKLLEENQTTENGNFSTGSIPNQKLSEYVFFLPTALAILQDNNQSSEQPQRARQG